VPLKIRAGPRKIKAIHGEKTQAEKFCAN